MDKPIETREEASAAFSQFMGEEPQEAGPAGDELVEELRGDDDGDGANDGSPPAEAHDGTQDDQGDGEQDIDLDTPGEVMEKLRKARQEAGTAGYKLHKTQKELEQKEAQLQAMEQRLQALETGQPAQQHDQQQQSESEIVRLSDSQLDEFMQNFDPDWDEAKEDPYMKRAGKYAAEIALAAVNSLSKRINSVDGGIQNMQFEQRLSSLGLSRPEFDAVWREPEYASWGEALSDDQKLNALEAQAGQLGRSPSQRAAPGQQNPSQQGAQPTSRVNPRTIEQSQAAGSAHNPRRLNELKLGEAVEKKDWGNAKKAARPLFDQLMQGG